MISFLLSLWESQTQTDSGTAKWTESSRSWCQPTRVEQRSWDRDVLLMTLRHRIKTFEIASWPWIFRYTGQWDPSAGSSWNGYFISTVALSLKKSHPIHLAPKSGCGAWLSYQCGESCRRFIPVIAWNWFKTIKGSLEKNPHHYVLHYYMSQL